MRKELIDAITALETEDGRITPDDIVRAAQDHNSPLHKEFEWDDAAAAQAHRLNQARELIRRVEVHIVINRVQVGVVGYVRDVEQPSNKQGYRSVRRLQSEEELARETVAAEFEHAASRLRRARDIAIALGLEGEIDQRIADLTGFGIRLRAESVPEQEVRAN
jgi:hypothetical protein